MRRALLTMLLGSVLLVGRAGPRPYAFGTPGADTLRYASLSADPFTAVSEETPRRGFFRRIVDYFGQSTEDRSREKKIDITFAGGPSYSKTTQLGLGLLAAGLYRFDRQDTITPPSDISIFANVSTSGFFSFGVTGNTIFRHNRQRLMYNISFSSSPRDLWGFGYDAGRYNPKTSYVEQRYRINARYLHSVVANAYAGVVFDFDHTKGRKFDATGLAYLNGENTRYTATGIGVVAEYDSRDFIPNPSRGVYLHIREIYYPKGLGSCPGTLFRTVCQANWYQQVWRGGLLAFDLYGEFNSDDAPWPLLARLGSNERMRGYYEGRYTDNCLITGQVELRQHIWRRIGGVAWVGAGNVFPRINDFRWSQTLPNYGLGLRWELKKRVNVRMDYGLGRRTSGFLLTLNEAF